MPTIPVTTYRDLIDHAVDYLGADVGVEAYREARRAIQSAHRILPASHRWSYFFQHGRVTTVASYTTGTIAYDHTGGAYERQLTLTSGTWPSWSAYGVVVIASVPYQVYERKSDTALTLSTNSNPGADVTAGTTYTIYRDTYPMPSDFIAADQVAAMGSSFAYPVYVHPSQWLIPQQVQTSPSTPRRYTFTASPDVFSAMAIRFHPAPDAIYNFDFIYQRRPRPLTIDEYSTGTVSLTGPTQTVSGTGTSWSSKHVGCVLRLSSDTVDLPTANTGSNPADVERMVISVESATSLTVDAAITGTYSAVKYVMSDPLDIEEGAMMSAYLRCVEAELARVRKQKDRAVADQFWRDALIQAREADVRHFETRVAGVSGLYRPGLRDMPRAADVS